MSTENNILVKLHNAGFKQNNKWLVEGVSLTVEQGKIVTLIVILCYLQKVLVKKI